MRLLLAVPGGLLLVAVPGVRLLVAVPGVRLLLAVPGAYGPNTPICSKEVFVWI